jgi:peptide/nickel transport system permease protein
VGTRSYILGKVLQALLTLAFVMVFNFFLFRVIPPDPLELYARSTTPFTPPNVEEIAQDLGLDKPVPQQFLIYAQDTLTLNFEDSFSFLGQDVKQVIYDHIWPTLLLVATSTMAAAGIGLLIGTYSGWRQGSRFDMGSQVFTLFVYAMPEFWFGILVLMAFAGGVGPFPALFPAGGYSTPGAELTGFAHVADVLNHLALPWFVLTITSLGAYVLIMRNSLIAVMNDQFVMTARAKGVRDRQILWRHVVPNALLPTFTLVLLSLGFVFGGVIAIEFVFSYPGLGLLTVRAIKSQDFPLLQGLFLLFSAVMIVANLVADISYSYLDPRVRTMPLVHRSRDRADVMLPEISREGARGEGVLADVARIRDRVDRFVVGRHLARLRCGPRRLRGAIGGRGDPHDGLHTGNRLEHRHPRSDPAPTRRYRGELPVRLGARGPLRARLHLHRREDPGLHVRSWPFRRRARRVHASPIDLGGHELAAP